MQSGLCTIMRCLADNRTPPDSRTPLHQTRPRLPLLGSAFSLWQTHRACEMPAQLQQQGHVGLKHEGYVALAPQAPHLHSMCQDLLPYPEAWRSSQVSLWFEFLLGNVSCTCLLFILWTAAWSQSWTETILSLFGHIRKIPDAGTKCLPRRAAESRLPRTRPGASLGVLVSSAGPESTMPVVSSMTNN